MSLPNSTCDSQRLRLLLADQLPEPLQAEAAEHVAQCENCRQALESFAAEGSWWSEVQACLQANAEHMGARSGDLSSAESSLGDRPGSDEAFAADFVVDFLEPCSQPSTLGRLGEYEILEVIARGGMGVVLKGFQRELGRYVAVKVVAPHLAASGAAHKRFIREARAAAAIVHPHVMPIHAVGTSGRLPYLVMPLVACESLQQRIDRQGALEIKEILRIGMQAAGGLAASHAQGLVHRDVKPANILLEKGIDRVMLTDFGLARAADDASLTRSGVVTGTPQYMSPEQAQGEAVDARSDLFSLGSVLYAMCAGRAPFRAETTLGVLRRICDTQPRPIRETNADVPEWLERIVGKLHEKSPEERFQSAGEVAEILEQCLAHVQQPTTVALPEACRRSPGGSPVMHPWDAIATRFSTRWRMAVGAIGILGVVGALAVQKYWSTHSPEQPSPDNASVARWDDGVAEALIELQGEIDPLEARAAQHWDDGPSFTEPPLNLPQLQNEQEIEP